MMANPLTGLPGVPGDGLAGAAFGMIGSEDPGDASFGYDDSQVVEQVTFEGGAGGASYWSNLKKTLKALFGTNARLAAGKLNRVPPARHPVFTDCYVERVTGIKGLGRRMRDKNNGLGAYERGVMMVVYTRRRYWIFGDREIVKESDRYVSRESQTSVFFVSLQGVQYTFPGGIPFKGTAGKREGERHIVLTWWNVPLRGIEEDNSDALNIGAVVGRINSDTFMGRAAGKVLCEGAQVRYKVSPVSTSKNAQDALAITRGDILCDVTYSLKVTLTRDSHNHFPTKDGTLAVPVDNNNQPVYQSVAFGSYICVPL